MDFEVTILGSGAAVPSLHRGTTSQYIFCHNRHILIDCGEGTQLQIRKYKVKLQHIQFILISHLHGDHIFGLPGLISTMQLLGRTQGLTIYGPKGLRKYIYACLEEVGKGVFFSLDIIELETNESGVIYEDKCIEIKHFPLHHGIPTHGYTIEEKPHKRRLLKEEFDATGVSVAYIQKLIQGFDIIDSAGVEVKSDAVTIAGKPQKKYAYCCDTAYSLEIIPYIAGSDLMYHDATFLDQEAERAEKTNHSTAKQAATIAFKSCVKRLLLGHFSARYRTTEQHLSEAQSIFDPVFVVEDGDIYKV